MAEEELKEELATTLLLDTVTGGIATGLMAVKRCSTSDKKKEE